MASELRARGSTLRRLCMPSDSSSTNGPSVKISSAPKWSTKKRTASSRFGTVKATWSTARMVGTRGRGVVVTGGPPSGDGSPLRGAEVVVGPREDVTAVLCGAHVGGPGVALEVLQPGRAAADAAQLGARLGVVDLLVGDGLQVLPHPQAPRVARGTQCRQHVIRADRLVSVRHARLLAEEQRAVVTHAGQGASRLGGQDLNVLAGIAISQGEGLLD